MDLRYPDKKFNWRYQEYMDNNEYSPSYWYHSYNTYRGVVPGQCKPYHRWDPFSSRNFYCAEYSRQTFYINMLPLDNTFIYLVSMNLAS